ncbi:MAG: ABC transporter substrate-binding protein [Rubrivivax sp.]|nr:ABC transporter substrate-binding protein [Rubrivivax sp.]
MAPDKPGSVAGEHVDGFAREYVIIAASALMRVPKGYTDGEAATLPCAALTACRALMVEGPLRLGETVLVQGTGGVSLFALQFAKASGATVIATSSSDGKLERLRALGADHVINYRTTPQWSRRVAEFTGGRGVDHVVEVGGAQTLSQSLRACRVGGHISMIGVLSGIEAPASTALLMMKNIRVPGITVASKRDQLDMVQAIESNGIRPMIDSHFPLDAIADAFRHEKSGRHFGKIVLDVCPSGPREASTREGLTWDLPGVSRRPQDLRDLSRVALPACAPLVAFIRPQSTHRRQTMKFDGRALITITAGLALAAAAMTVQAQDKVVRFGMAQNFTKVYSFLTAEYSQGQREYFTLVNERGAVNGWKIHAEIVDTGNETQRGIEGCERFKREGVVLIDPLSTPVSRALVRRVLADKINMVTISSGRSDASDGSAVPYVLPMSPTQWSQAAALVEYIGRQEKNPKGKKIVYVHIDTPLGKEPLSLLQDLAKRRGFEMLPVPYPPPGNEQSAVWTQVRRAAPDWTVIWGGGVRQKVPLKEAARNGIPMDHVPSSVALSESDMKVAGSEATKGVLKFQLSASGREPKPSQDILKEGIARTKGAGPAELVGTTYYNMGVYSAALMVEGVRRAIEITKRGPVTAEALNEGLRSITTFNADGPAPPVTMSKSDHQGGDMGRIAQWDGQRWVAKSDWIAGDQVLVWNLIGHSSAEFKKSK